MSLLTLGAQVASIKLTKGLNLVYLSVLLRLIGGPLLAYLMILLFGLEGITAQAIFIASAMPTSVNSSVVAQEYSDDATLDRKSTRLNSSHVAISYAVFCLKKKNQKT